MNVVQWFNNGDDTGVSQVVSMNFPCGGIRCPICHELGAFHGLLREAYQVICPGTFIVPTSHGKRVGMEPAKYRKAVSDGAKFRRADQGPGVGDNEEVG